MQHLPTQTATELDMDQVHIAHLQQQLIEAEQQADWVWFEQVVRQLLSVPIPNRELMRWAIVLRKSKRQQVAQQILALIVERYMTQQRAGTLAQQDRLDGVRALVYASRFEEASAALLAGLAADSQFLQKPSPMMHKTLHMLVNGLLRLGAWETLVDVLLRLYQRQSVYERQAWLVQLLQICSQKGIFAVAVLALAEQVIQQTDTAFEVMEPALSLMLQWQGATVMLMDQYERLLLRLSNDQLATYWSVFLIGCNLLWLHRATNRLERVAAHLSDWSAQLQQMPLPCPALAWLVQQTPALAEDHARQVQADVMLAAEQSVQQMTQQLWFEQLADPHHQIAVVGNAASEFGQGRGILIDQHQTVIRFNRYSVAVPYVADYGSKVDVEVQAITALRDKCTAAQISGAPVIVVSYLSFFAYFRDWDLIVQLLAQGYQVASYPVEHYLPTLQQMRRIPSSGLFVASILSSIRAKAAHPVDYYGFAFVDQIGEQAKSSHYFEQSKPLLHHDWQQEVQVFERLTGQQLAVQTLASAPLRIKLIGDHRKYHCGCAAVSDYLTQQILRVGRLIPESDQQAAYDVLVVNGEGSMHHRSNAYHKKTQAMQAAKQQAKPVLLLNTVWQDNGAADQALIHQLDQVTLREPLSQMALQQEVGRDAPVYLDCSYWAEVRSNAPITDFKQQWVVTDFYSPEFEDFVRVTKGFWSFQPYIDMRQMSWSSLVNSLKTAELLVTGRHHAMYAACRARTPFVVLAGNTHKIEGLIAMSGLPIPVCRHPRELRAALQWAREHLAVYHQLFDWMEHQPALPLAEMLQALPARPIDQNCIIQ